MSEKIYNLSKKPFCKKHPSKQIEYFCINPSCNERIFCHTCLFKKEYCRHDSTTDIKEIGEFLYEQKVLFDMKGLSSSPNVFDYLQNKNKREQFYRDQLQSQYFKLEADCDNLLKRMHSLMDDVKLQVRQQIEEYNKNYQFNSQKLINKISENFQKSFLSRFQTFEELNHTYDLSSQKGLLEMLETMVQDKEIVNSYSPEIEQLFQNITSLQKQIPEFDIERFDDVKKYFNIFNDKMQQNSQILLQINPILDEKDQLESISFKGNTQQNENQQPHKINLGQLRKIQASANFNSTHFSTVYCMCKLPNKKFATGSDDGSIKIFDAVSMECEQTLKGHTQGVRDLIALPNGNLVSASFDKTIRVWNITTSLKESKLNSKDSISSQIKILSGHVSSVLSIRYLGDNLLASGSADYTIKIWDFNTGELQKTLSGHMNDVLCLTSTKQINFLISGSSDKTIKLWNMAKKYSSACHKTLSGHLDFVWSVFLCQDDQTLISGGVDKHIKLWNIQTGETLMTLTGHQEQVNKVMLYGENIVLSSSLDGTLKFWDTTLKMCVHNLEGHNGSVNCFQIMDDKSILSSGADQSIFIWN